MQQRDRDVLEHMIRYCDRIAGFSCPLDEKVNFGKKTNGDF